MRRFCRLLRSWLPLALLLAGGCQVPDVKPFAEATSRMGTALGTSLHLVEADFQRLDSLDAQALSSPQRDTLARYQRRLHQATQAFGGVRGALNDYAASLTALTAARQQTDKQLDAITAAIGKLAAAAGPWGQALGLATGPVNSLVQDVGAIYTLHELHRKVTAQDSAIQRLARYLAGGLVVFGRLDAAASQLYATNAFEQYRPLTHYYQAAQVVQNQALGLLQNIAELRAARYRLATAPPDQAAGLRQDVLASAQELARRDPALRRAARQHSPLTTEAYYTELDQRETYYKTRLLDPQVLALYQQAQRQLRAYATEQQQHQALLASSEALLRAWAGSHRALQAALTQARRRPPAQELLAQALAIQKAVADIEALQLRATAP